MSEESEKSDRVGCEFTIVGMVSQVLIHIGVGSGGQGGGGGDSSPPPNFTHCLHSELYCSTVKPRLSEPPLSETSIIRMGIPPTFSLN